MNVHTSSLPAALLRVERTATQPQADGIVSYAQLLDRVSALSSNPRVHVEWIGKSRMGRLIPAIIVTADTSPAVLASSRLAAAELAAAGVSHDQPAKTTMTRPRLTTVPDDAALPILFTSGNYGNELAQVEAGLRLAKSLAEDTSPEVEAALRHVALIIIPTNNPDGHESALQELALEPLSSAMRSAGNFFEQQILREYLHQVEPESEAIAGLISRWKPFLVCEVHEDSIGLGWQNPETCLAPPMGPASTPGFGGMIDMPAGPGENDPRLHEEIRRYGRAIAREWHRLDYNVLHQDDGRHGWPKCPGEGPAGLTPQPETRFTRAMGLRGVVSFIIESCRLPGNQTWEDRVGQKASAGRAILLEVADHRQKLVDIVGAVADRAVAAGLGGSGEFFVIPLAQDLYLLRRAMNILRLHGIQMYHGTSPQHGRSVVVPAAQPLGPTLSVLLDIDEGQHQSLVVSLGLRVIASRTLSPTESSAWSEVSLTPAVDVAPTLMPWMRSRNVSKSIDFDNGHQAPALVNRILRSPGGRVSWRAGIGGGFLADYSGDPLTIYDLTRGLDIVVNPAEGAGGKAGAPLRPLRVGILRGQGFSRSGLEGTVGRIRKFLTEWEFSFILLTASDLKPQILADIDVLIVPHGLADELVNGPLPNYLWHRHPWELDEPDNPLGEAEAATLRAWIDAGGTYVGIDAGGGLLATRPYLGLIDAEVTAKDLGIGLVELSMDQPQDPIFDGIAGRLEADGVARTGFMPAFYQSNPWYEEPGGCVFALGKGAVSLASYSATLPVKGVNHISPIGSFSVSGGGTAIATARHGAGTVTVFGIQPCYRSYFLSTARLIANAIFKHCINNQ
ncbi:M14 family zinc carboxypeptidase [Mesorhizobium sp. 2RAF21]|uniref:M14 family zinc carboxypeptidase n=1 Tax=Mesorhizobium sp. 2RAF21 TaxID=3232995 RepID=UPI003F990BFF